MSTGNSQGGMVYGIEGVSQCITSGTHGYAMGNIYDNRQYDLRNICINDRGFVNKEPQIAYGYCPTLRAESHGNVPKVFVGAAMRGRYNSDGEIEQ